MQRTYHHRTIHFWFSGNAKIRIGIRNQVIANAYVRIGQHYNSFHSLPFRLERHSSNNSNFATRNQLCGMESDKYAIINRKFGELSVQILRFHSHPNVFQCNNKTERIADRIFNQICNVNIKCISCISKHIVGLRNWNQFGYKRNNNSLLLSTNGVCGGRADAKENSLHHKP